MSATRGSGCSVRVARNSLMAIPIAAGTEYATAEAIAFGTIFVEIAPGEHGTVIGILQSPISVSGVNDAIVSAKAAVSDLPVGAAS